MKKFVYLAGPIAGCNENEANDWRSFVQENLNRNIVGISPLRCEPISENHYTSGTDSRFNTPKAIAAKNWYDTEACDLVLAYLPKELNLLFFDLNSTWIFDNFSLIVILL